MNSGSHAGGERASLALHAIVLKPRLGTADSDHWPGPRDCEFLWSFQINRFCIDHKEEICGPWTTNTHRSRKWHTICQNSWMFVHSTHSSLPLEPPTSGAPRLLCSPPRPKALKMKFSTSNVLFLASNIVILPTMGMKSSQNTSKLQTWNKNYPKGEIHNGTYPKSWLKKWDEMAGRSQRTKFNTSASLCLFVSLWIFLSLIGSMFPKKTTSIAYTWFFSQKLLWSSRLPRPLLPILAAPARHERTNGRMITCNGFVFFCPDPHP